MLSSTRVVLVAILVSTLACTREPQAPDPQKPAELSGTLVIATPTGTAPAADARVTVEGSRFLVRADAQGHFVLRGLDAGRLRLHFVHAPSNGERFESVVLESSFFEGVSRDLGTVVIGAVGSLSGRVVSGDSGVPGALVALPFVATARTDPSGAFTFERVPAGEYEAAVYLDGRETAALHTGGTAEVKSKERSEITLDLDVMPIAVAGAISGRVRAPGAAPGGIAIEASDVGVARVVGTTNDEGTFFGSLPPGVYTVTVRRSSASASLSNVVVGGTVELPDFSLDPLPSARCPGQLEDAADADGDGAIDANEPATCRCDPTGTVDADLDGVCDGRDRDADGDGRPDDLPACTGSACPPGDSDHDGIADAEDNCPALATDDTDDQDADGLGNACDPCPETAGTTCPPLPRRVGCTAGGFCIERTTPIGPDTAQVAATSASDAWALGETSLLWHWDGLAWTEVPNPAREGILESTLTVSGPGEVWLEVDNGTVWHLKGGAWTQRRGPDATPSYLLDLAAGGPDDVWLLESVGTGRRLQHWDGATLTPTPTTTLVLDEIAVDASGTVVGRTRDALFAWSGTAWVDLPVPAANGAQLEVLRATAGTIWIELSPDALLERTPSGWTRHDFRTWRLGSVFGGQPGAFYATARGSYGGQAVFEYDGTKWRRLPIGLRDDLTSLVTLPTGEGWAVGREDYLELVDGTWTRGLHQRAFDGVIDGSTTPDGALFLLDRHGLVHRRFAGRLTTIVPPPFVEAYRLHGVSATELWIGTPDGELLHSTDAGLTFVTHTVPASTAFSAVTGSGSANVWAFTPHESLRWNGTAWAVTKRRDGTSHAGLSAVFATPDGAAWSVADGSVWHFTAPTGWELDHTDGTMESLGGFADASGKAEEMWAIRSDGSVVRWRVATGWTPVADPGVHFTAAALVSPTEVYFGDNAVVKLFDGTSWTQVDTVSGVLGVLLADATSALRLGPWGVRRLDGTTQKTVIEGLPGSPPGYGATWMGGPNDVWAGGDDGSVLHFDGTTWKERRRPDDHRVDALDGDGSGAIWVGSNAWTEHWDGTTWTEHPLVATATVRHIHGTAGGALVAGADAMYEWRGSQWTRLTIPTSVQNLEWVDVGGRSLDDAWLLAANQDIGSALLIRRENGAFTDVSPPDFGNCTRSARRLAVAPDGAIAIANDTACVLRRAPGGTWTADSPEGVQNIEVVAFDETGRLFASGNRKYVTPEGLYHAEPALWREVSSATWERVELPTSSLAIEDLAAAGGGVVYVGNRGTIALKRP